MMQHNQTDSLDDFAALLSRSIEESGKYEPCMSLSVHEDGNAVELNLDTSVASYSEGIKGEGSDIGLFRSLDTRKVVGVRLPLYRKNLVVSHAGDIRINCGFRKEGTEGECVPANQPNQTERDQPQPKQRDEAVDARPLVIDFTEEPPTKAGIYLHRWGLRDIPRIMRVEYRESHRGMCVWTKGGRRLVSELGGEWCGPLVEGEPVPVTMTTRDWHFCANGRMWVNYPSVICSRCCGRNGPYRLSDYEIPNPNVPSVVGVPVEACEPIVSALESGTIVATYETCPPIVQITIRLRDDATRLRFIAAVKAARDNPQPTSEPRIPDEIVVAWLNISPLYDQAKYLSECPTDTREMLRVCDTAIKVWPAFKTIGEWIASKGSQRWPETLGEQPPAVIGVPREVCKPIAEASPEQPTIDLAAATREAVDEVRRVAREELIEKQDEETKRLANLGCVSVEACSKFLEKVKVADTTAMQEFKSACAAARRGEERLKDAQDEAAAKIAELEQQLAEVTAERDATLHGEQCEKAYTAEARKELGSEFDGIPMPVCIARLRQSLSHWKKKAEEAESAREAAEAKLADLRKRVKPEPIVYGTCHLCNADVDSTEGWSDLGDGCFAHVQCEVTEALRVALKDLQAARDVLRKCRVLGLRFTWACCPICGAAANEDCSPTCELGAALKGNPADRRKEPAVHNLEEKA